MGVMMWLAVVPLAYAAHLWLLGRPESFNIENIPDGTTKVAIVTGANTGLGLATSRAFARAGFTVILACRSNERGEEALRSLQSSIPGGKVLLELLDLSEPTSIHDFVDRVSSKFEKLDILVNNAATMGTPETRNSLGWEAQFAIGHFGHFILSSRLFRLLKAAQGRIVNVSSLNAFDLVHGLDLNDLLVKTRPYDPFVQYGSTKRANLLFTHELNKRFAADGITATAAHPGGTLTDLLPKASGYASSGRWGWLYRVINSFVFQSVLMDADYGALSQIRAAVNASADDFIGPAYFVRGPPVRIGTSLHAWFNPFPFQAKDAAELWRRSEEITGERFASS